MVRVTRIIARKWLGDVPEEKGFWCQDGRALKNLSELEVALREMGDETFRYHSSERGNDFSNWIRDVIGDDKLAEDLQKKTDRIEAARAVADRIAWLKKR